MSVWFEDGTEYVSPFGFDEIKLEGSAVQGVRTMYAAMGVVAIAAGTALLMVPGRTLLFVTVILGLYFLISGLTHLCAAIAIKALPGGWRALSVVTSLLLVLGGILILRNQPLGAFVVGTIVVLVTGFCWMIEGAVTLLESEASAHPALAIAGGILSIVAGLIVFTFPLESFDLLVTFAGAAMFVFGIVLIARAATFGRTKKSDKKDKAEASAAEAGRTEATSNKVVA